VNQLHCAQQRGYLIVSVLSPFAVWHSCLLMKIKAFSRPSAFVTLLLFICSLAIPIVPAQEERRVSNDSNKTEDFKEKSDEYWKEKLAPDVYQVTRCSSTEEPFTGKYWNNHSPGIYKCSNCGHVLFNAKDKFDSGTGWPSFNRPQGDGVESRV